MLKFLDIILTILHLAVIGCNVFAWIFPKWRKAHFYCVMATLCSWLILGIWKGFGYCFLTDWAWQIKRRIGESDLPNSFITYMVNNKLGFNVPTNTIDTWTVILFTICVLIAIYFRVANFISMTKT